MCLLRFEHRHLKLSLKIQTADFFYHRAEITNLNIKKCGLQSFLHLPTQMNVTLRPPPLSLLVMPVSLVGVLDWLKTSLRSEISSPKRHSAMSTLLTVIKAYNNYSLGSKAWLKYKHPIYILKGKEAGAHLGRSGLYYCFCHIPHKIVLLLSFYI